MPINHRGPAVHAARVRLRRRRRRAILSVLLLLLLLLGGFSFYQSSYFWVAAYQVTGLDRLTVDEVQEALGLDTQMLIWRLQPGRLEQKLLAEIPRIASVRVVRKLPNQVRVHLVERVDTALLQQDERDYLVLDADGIPIEKILDYPENGLPVVSGIEVPQTVQMGKPLPSRTLSSAMELIAAFGDRAASLVSEVIAGQDDSMTVFLVDGTTVYFGSDGNWGLKVQALAGILDDLQKRGARARYIDLRSVYRPVVQEK